MVNIASLVAGLRRERERAEHEVQRLNAAIAALSWKRAGKVTGRRPKRTLSTAARRRIAAAQRARWAKWKAEKSKKAAKGRK